MFLPGGIGPWPSWLTSILSLGKHVSNVSATCFYHLRRLRHIRRSLTSESATTLVYAFVTSRVDCNVLRCAAGHQLVIPSHRLTTWSSGLFSSRSDVMELTAHNLRDPSHTAAVFGQSLKHFFSQSTSVPVHGANWVHQRHLRRCAI